MKKLILSSSLIAVFVLALDQATKYYVKANLGYFDVIKIAPFFNIVYAENTGSAFGMFKELGAFFFIAVSVAAVFFIALLILKDRSNAFAYSLLLGGACGNLIDRIIYGYVIDFLDFHIWGYHWPAFNIADSALTLGIFSLIVRTIFDISKQRGRN